MNHVHRVQIKVISQPSEVKGETGFQDDKEVKCFSVIVKTAPKEVRVCSDPFCVLYTIEDNYTE